jgi:hypothetical protein
MRPDPHLINDVLLGLIGAGGFSFVVGWYLIAQATNNLREGSVPLTSTIKLTGFVGRAGALVLFVAGSMAMLAGGVLFVLAIWRMATWLMGP